MSDTTDDVWPDDVWQLDQAVMDAEALSRPADQIARLRAIRDRLEARLATDARPAPYPCLDTPEPD